MRQRHCGPCGYRWPLQRVVLAIQPSITRCLGRLHDQTHAVTAAGGGLALKALTLVAGDSCARATSPLRQRGEAYGRLARRRPFGIAGGIGVGIVRWPIGSGLPIW